MIPVLITVVQGDKNFDLNFTLTDSQNLPVDLTGGTVTFNAQLQSDYSVKFSGNMTVVSAIDGVCKYTVQNNDLEVPGTYNAQIQLSLASGAEIITFTGITVIVAAEIPIPVT